MPLVAIRTDTDERIDLTEVNFEDEIKLKEINCKCPLCGNELIFRRSHRRNDSEVRSHFYHRSDCDSDYISHAESAEHLAAKRYLKRVLSNSLDGVDGVRIELEYPIMMEWREKGRIADICVIFGSGQKEVYECQLSPISLEDLKARTEDYIRAGCDPYWYLGINAATQQNILYLYKKFGEVFELHVG